jgi:predicted small secreted protein
MSHKTFVAAGLAFVLLLACFVTSATATSPGAGDVNLAQMVLVTAPSRDLSISLSGIHPDGDCEVGSGSGCPY